MLDSDDDDDYDDDEDERKDDNTTKEISDQPDPVMMTDDPRKLVTMNFLCFEIGIYNCCIKSFLL